MSTSRRLRAAASLLAALVPLACGGGGGGGGGGPPPLAVGVGPDLLDASATMQAQLPAGFFGPGTDPFTGSIAFEGIPIPTIGPFELGTTDTLVRRRGELVLGPDATAPVVVELIALSLRSVNPIQITTNGMNPQLWNVAITFGPVAPNFGTASVTRAGATTGGTFSASIPIHPFLTVTGPGARPPQDLGASTLVSPSPGTWTTIDASPTAPLRVTGLALGVAFTGSLNAPTPLGPLELVLAPATPSPRPPANVDPTATIEAGVSLARNAVVGAGAVVRAGAVVGPNATIGAGATVGPRAILGAGAQVAAGATVGADAVLDDGAALLPGAPIQLGTGVVIGPGTQVGEGCSLGDGVHVGGLGTIGANTTIGADTRIGRQVGIGAGCVLASNLRIERGATIPAATNQTSGIYRCHLAGGGVELRGPPSTWSVGAAAAWIAGRLDGREAPLLGIPAGSTGSASSSHPGLAGDVGTDTAAPSNGGTGPFNWDQDGHLCAWFAETLRAKLAAKGYDTTFTALYRLNPDWAWWKNAWVDKWIDAHAVTDVHWPDGSITWVEPQFVGAAGVDEPVSTLDGDGDGQVEYWDGEHVDEPSDGDMRVEVYKSRADAEAHGVKTSGV